MGDYKKWIPILKAELDEFMKTAPAISTVHKNDHIERVWKKSEQLCKKLKGDLEVMVAAVFLHDLGRHYGLEIHGEKSAELAKPILERIGFPKEKIPKALEAIAQHDYNFPPEKRKLLEAKILYDIDKIDSLGIVGIYRHCVFVNNGRIKIETIGEECDKRYKGLALPESKKLAKKNYLLIKDFFKKLEKELKA